METHLCTFCGVEHPSEKWYGRPSFIEPSVIVYKCALYVGGVVKRSVKYEYIPERIKEDRRQHAKDILQPFREGEPSREFAEAYPKEAAKIFVNEKKKPKYVWKGDL